MLIGFSYISVVNIQEEIVIICFVKGTQSNSHSNNQGRTYSSFN